MIDKEKLVGVVVWYNPTENNLKTILTYIDDISVLIIIDNSNISNKDLVIEQYEKHLNKIVYKPNYKNKGIAKALNQGCHKAMEYGAEWTLTMDQDSSFEKNDLSELIEKANNYNEFDKVCIFSPLHFYEDAKENSQVWPNEYTLEDSVMTSGNLLSMNVYKKLGDFRNDFFIDMVDFEYCCRARKHGFQIVLINSILLNHHLGDACISVKFMGIVRNFYDHSPFRQYYIFRNTLYLKKLYPEYKKVFKQRLLKQFKRVILYDNNKKSKKIAYMAKGIFAYIGKSSGPLKNS